jgi:hypothetical protein
MIIISVAESRPTRPMNLAFTCKYLIINGLGFGFDFWTEMKKAPLGAWA